MVLWFAVTIWLLGVPVWSYTTYTWGSDPCDGVGDGWITYCESSFIGECNAAEPGCI